MSRSQSSTECAHCGESFPARRPACPHCGSDHETGWRDPDELEGARFGGHATSLDDEEYADWMARDGGLPSEDLPLSVRLRRFGKLAVLALLLLLFLLLYAL